MKLWQRWVGRVGSTDPEAVEELRLHLELRTADKVRSGLDEAEARRQARLELGNPEAVREQLRDARPGAAAETLLRDARFAVRSLRRSGAFTTAFVLTLAVGVGASTALFAIVDAALVRPLPYPEPERLVAVFDVNSEKGIERTGSASGNIQDWRRQAREFEGLAGYYTMGRTLSGGGAAEVVVGAQVTEGFFEVLGVPAALGRTFSAEETARARLNSAAAPIGPDPVVVLGHDLWQRRFGADPGIVGRTVTLERLPFQVVGVMPAGFATPGADAELYIPWDISGSRTRDQHYVEVVGRVRRGASLEQARRDLEQVAGHLASEYPATNAGWSVQVVPLHEVVVGEAGTTLRLLLGAVGLLLFAACANLGLLGLARGLERAHEASIRLALGASRGRLLRQFLTESLLLAAAGGGLGCAVAIVGVAVVRRGHADLPRLAEASVDPRALGFALAATVVAGLVAGLPAAWRSSGVEPARGLPAESARIAAGAGRPGLRDALVVAEVTLAVVLLAGAALLWRSHEHLRSAPVGFDPAGVLVAPVFLDSQAYAGGDAVRGYYARLFERLAALPGVVSVGGATALPTSPLGPDFERPLWPESHPLGPDAGHRAWVRLVTPGYFRTLGMRLVDGRDFGSPESPDAPRSVVVAEGLARRLWPDGKAVGRRLVIDYGDPYPYQVVGVVSDVRFDGPRSRPRHEIYLAHAQRPYLILNVAVRTDGPPGRWVPAVKQVLREMDPDKPAQGVYALGDLLAATYARERAALVFLAAFAGVAVLLAVLAVYGVLTHRVRERSREIGIRLALGARPVRLVAWVAGHGLRLTVAGAVLGLGLAALGGRALDGLLYGVSPADPGVAAAVVLIPVLAGLAAAALPARRAAGVDPVWALRGE